MKIVLTRVNLSWVEEVSPPLGFAYLAAAVKSSGHTVKIIDGRLLRISVNKLADLIIAENPDVIGVSVLSPEAYETSRLYKILKNSMPAVPIIGGGPHITALPARSLTDKLCDISVPGEGEKPLTEILKIIENSGDITTVPGVLSLRKGRVDPGPPRIHDGIDELSVPAWNIVSPENYWNSGEGPLIHSGKRYLPIMTSRGCSRQCGFCGHSLGKIWRPRSVCDVVNEMNFLAERGCDDFHIQDDSFNEDVDRAIDILQTFAEIPSRPSLCFPNGLLADRITEQLAKALKNARTYRVGIGIESSSSRIQNIIRKYQDIDTIRKSVEMLVENDISVHGFFMLGFPGESIEEMYKTIRYACSLPLASAEFSLFLPLPGTEMGRDVSLKDLAALRIDNSSASFSESDEKSDVLYGGPGIDAEMLKTIRAWAYRRFYMSLKRIKPLSRAIPLKISLVPRLAKAVYGRLNH